MMAVVSRRAISALPSFLLSGPVRNVQLQPRDTVLAIGKRLIFSRATSHRNSPESTCSKSRPQPSLVAPGFWSSRATWRRASVNTLRCLVGCTLGDFSAMWYLQASHPDLGLGVIMAASMASGVSTSLLLEATFLRFGRDQLPWVLAARTAAGMSMISMLTMELVENAVDYQISMFSGARLAHLVVFYPLHGIKFIPTSGGVVRLDSPTFWIAAVLSISAGFLSPLPYNYVRLRKHGKACH